MEHRMTDSRPFRFGVQISRSRSASDWRWVAQRAEELDFDVFLMPDHFGPQFAIGPALATVAAATSTIRIGTLVLQNDLRHPALMVKDFNTLDVLSDGRVELGVGAGGSFVPEYGWTGIPFDPPGPRVSRLEESVRAIKGLSAEGPFSFAGKHYTFTDYDAFPKPLQQPHVPLLIAGGGKRMLRLAAREADIVGLLPSMKPVGGEFEDENDMDAFAAKAAFVRAEAGERADQLEFNILVQQFQVTDGSDAALEQLRQDAVARGNTDASWFDSPMVFVGTVEQIAAKLIEVRERAGVSYFTVFEPVMEEFAAVITHLGADA
jgi:probable F420-dependent oxidoreductase